MKDCYKLKVKKSRKNVTQEAIIYQKEEMVKEIVKEAKI